MAGLRTVGVRLQADVTGFKAGLGQARTAAGELRGELDKAARAGKLDAVADQATKMGLGLAGAFAVAVGAAAKFDKQMSEVGAVSDATGKQMEQLRQAALKAGADTAFSATEAAQAEAELAKAGLDTSQILGGALTGSLSLAAAGSLDLAEAADISAKTMNVFKLEGKDVGHIADVLAASANKSATDVHEMGEALKMGGLAASSAGMSMEETVGTLSAFADRALSGSDAGTSLKTAIMMLQAPSAKAAGVMQDLGIAAYDANGQFVGTAKLAGNLQQALGGLTQEQRNAALATIFGADGMRAANVLYELGEKGVQDYVKAVDDQGAAAEVAAKKMDNLAGDVEKLTGSLETMAIQAGSGANGGLRILVQSAGALVDEIGQLPAPLTSALTVMAGLSGGVLLLGAGWIRVRRSTQEMLSELREVGPGGQKAARGLETASKWAGRAAIAFAAFEIAGAAVGAMQKDLNPQIDALGKGLAEWGDGGKLAGESARVLGTDMQDVAVGLKFLADTDNSRRKFARWGQELLEGVVPGLDGTNTSLTRTKERVGAMDSALAQLVSGGQADQAKAAFDRLAEAAARDGVSVEELKVLFPQYAGAVEVAGNKSADAAPKIGGVGGEAKTAAQKVEDLKAAFDNLFGQRMSYDEALIAYRQGIKDVNKELETGKRTLDTHKQAGRDNATAVLDQIDKIKGLRQANIDNNMSIADADAAYKGQIATLRTTLLNLGYNETAVDALIGKYKAVPDDVSTDVSAPGAAKAKQQVQDFNFAVKTVPPSKTVPFRATVAEAKAAVEALRLKIAQIQSKHVYISGSVRWTSSGDLKVPGGTQLKNRWGGVYEHAATGLLREAQVASPQGPARYAWAEPATGGELFAPKYGDMNLTRRNVGYAVENWWGGSVQWGGKMAAPIAYTSAGVGGNRTTVLQVTLQNRGVIGSQVEVENWLAGAVDNLKRQGRV